MALTKGKPVEKEEEEVAAQAEAEEASAPQAETEKAPPAPAEAQTKEVATTKPTSMITGDTATAISELADAGFDDLALGFGAFPMITLPGQMFESSEGHNLGAEFTCRIVRKDSKTLYKGVDPEDDEKENVVYSYDGEVTTNGEELTDVLKVWKDKGYKIERKNYFDVVVEVQSGPMEGKIAILSLPPTARTTFSGYIVGIKLQHNELPNKVVTKVHVGPKIQKAVKPYYPWAFDCISLVVED